jgi:dienelactone hydrolase
MRDAIGPPSFEITPANPILIGDALTIKLANLQPGQQVKIVSERTFPTAVRDRPILYRSVAWFIAEGRELDLAIAKPLSGDYRLADVRGLFWSMKPTSGADASALPIMHVRLVASVEGRTIASAEIRFIDALPDTAVEAVPELPGAVFTYRRQSYRQPALIVLGGSEGGARTTRRRALQFASRGFPTLTFPYYSPPTDGDGRQEVPSLPASFVNIAVDRLEVAIRWLRERSEIDIDRLALLGKSKGAEFALLAAVHVDGIGAVIAEAPTDVVWEGWGPDAAPGACSSFAIRGTPLPFVPYIGMGEELYGLVTDREVQLRRPQGLGRAAHPLAAVRARIPMETFRGRLLLIGSMDDCVWASAMMAQNIAERRAEAGLKTSLLIFADAGHQLGGHGWDPTTQHNSGPRKMGGTPEGTAAAQCQAFPAILGFLRQWR